MENEDTKFGKKKTKPGMIRKYTMNQNSTKNKSYN